MTTAEFIALAMATVGCLFTLLGAVGLVRMPDVYMRISTSAKASTMGVALIVLASAVLYWELSLTVRAFFVVAFIFMTVPVASHLISRAAYVSGVKLWSGTGCDDLAGKYDRVSKELKGGEEDTKSGKQEKA